MDTYTTGNVVGYSMSEKHNGVQGVWDGRIMKTKTGNQIHAPAWFTNTLPRKPLRGELWTARGIGEFDKCRATVCSKKIDDEKWRRVQYMVFKGATTQDNLGPYAHLITKHQINSMAAMEKFYQEVLDNHGEGIVLEHGNHELKRVPIKDDDGKLIGYTQGKNPGQAGAFILQLRNGKQVKIGVPTQLKTSPPAMGAIIKFTYCGHTANGQPKCTAYAGIRAETSLNF